MAIQYLTRLDPFEAQFFLSGSAQFRMTVSDGRYGLINDGINEKALAVGAHRVVSRIGRCRLRSAGTRGSSADTAGGSRSRIAAMTLACVFPSNAFRPVSSLSDPWGFDLERLR